MSCVICFNNFNDDSCKCYNICEEGHTLCLECFNRLTRPKKCPTCRKSCRASPILTRINPITPEPAVVPNLEQTEEETVTVPPTLDFELDNRPVVVLIDTSGSMEDKSGDSRTSPQRIELVGHMMKILLRFCRILKKESVFYQFNSSLSRLKIDKNTKEDKACSVIEKMVPNNCTNLGASLGQLYQSFGDNAIYFVLTDGAPSDETADAIKKYDNADLHLIAFSSDVNTELLTQVSQQKNHTISYVQSIDSLMGYIIPIFVWAMTSRYEVTLTDRNEEYRSEYVRMLEPQINGLYSEFSVNDLLELVKRGRTNYAKDLKADTEKNDRHGRVAYSFENSENWHDFGKFYIKCLLHCHKHKIPGNAFDLSLQHYKTPEYEKVYSCLAGEAEKITFVAFRADANVREQVSQQSRARVKQTIRYVDNYRSTSSCDDNDGCITGESIVDLKNGLVTQMKNIRIGEQLEGGTVKWIIRIKNLNNGKPFKAYNGLTRSHPVQENGVWKPASKLTGAKVTEVAGNEIVYDVVLAERDAPNIIVNGLKTAVVGYPVPGMVHPYWGSNKVLDDLERVCPGGGFVDVDGKNFKETDGLVSSIF